MIKDQFFSAKDPSTGDFLSTYCICKALREIRGLGSSIQELQNKVAETVNTRTLSVNTTIAFHLFCYSPKSWWMTYGGENKKMVVKNF